MRGTLLGPVFRWGGDAPYISRLIQRQAQQPELLVLVHRDAVHNPCGGIGAGWKTLQPNLNSNCQRAREPRRTSLGVHEDDQSGTGKSPGRILDGQSDRNFAGNSSSPAELGTFIGRPRIQVYRLTPSPQKLACNPKSISNKQKEETKYVRN
jgi:hypothetical protein